MTFTFPCPLFRVKFSRFPPDNSLFHGPFHKQNTDPLLDQIDPCSLCPHQSLDTIVERTTSTVPLSNTATPISEVFGSNEHGPRSIEANEELHCHGKRRFFELAEAGNKLLCHVVRNRVSVADPNLVAFMENNCYMNITRSSEGTFIAFRLIGDKQDEYRLGIVRRLIFSHERRDNTFPDKCDGVLAVEEWLGGRETNPDNNAEYPDFFNNSVDYESMFELKIIEFSKSDSFDLVPINQFSGFTPSDPAYCWMKNDLINPNDHCIQASSKGADLFPKGFEKKVRINQRHNPPQDECDQSWVRWPSILEEDAVRKNADLLRQYQDFQDRAKSQSKLLQDWNRMPGKSVKADAKCLHVTVTRGNGDPLTASELSSINEDIAGKRLLPSVEDCINQNHFQRFHCIGKTGYNAVMKEWRNEGISEEYAQSLLDKHSSYTFKALVPNQSRLFRGDNKRHFCKVFAGRTNVPRAYSSERIQFRLPSANLAFTVDDSDHSTISDLVPLSTVACEPGLHSLVVTMRHLDLARYATGRRGNSSDRRTLQPVGGGLNYLGNRISGSQSQPSPTEGPGVAHLYQLWNRESHDPRFLYPYVTMCKYLSNNLFWNSLPLFQTGLRAVTMSSPQRMAGFCDLLIFTFNNFNCASHVDKNDNVDGKNAENIMKIAKFLRDCEDSVPEKKESIAKLCDFFEEMGVGVPTTCAYQYARHQGAPRVFVWSFFVMETLRIAIALREWTTHIFQGGLVVHGTAVPIYHVKGLVWIEKPPKFVHQETSEKMDTVNPLAWGAGRNDKTIFESVELAASSIADDGSNWVHKCDTEECGKEGEPVPTAIYNEQGPYGPNSDEMPYDSADEGYDEMDNAELALVSLLQLCQ